MSYYKLHVLWIKYRHLYCGWETHRRVFTNTKENNLTQIHFEGFKTKEELAMYFKAADIFVHPTREDIWGLVINESMAYGLPVITTNKCVAGMELITNKECLIDTDNSEQLKSIMEN